MFAARQSKRVVQKSRLSSSNILGMSSDTGMALEARRKAAQSKGDLHIAVLNVHGVGSSACKIMMRMDDNSKDDVFFGTPWSVRTTEEHGWSEPQVALVRVPMDASGTIVLQVYTQGKMNRKNRFGEVRVKVADCLQKSTSPQWLDIEPGEVSLGASMSGSQRLRVREIQHHPPQVLVKILYVGNALGAAAADFELRRKKLLDAPLPDQLSEDVKTLVPRKPLPQVPNSPKGHSSSGYVKRGRRDSLLMASGAKQALKEMARRSSIGNYDDDDDDDDEDKKKKKKMQSIGDAYDGADAGNYRAVDVGENYRSLDAGDSYRAVDLADNYRSIDVAGANDNRGDANNSDNDNDNDDESDTAGNMYMAFDMPGPIPTVEPNQPKSGAGSGNLLDDSRSGSDDDSDSGAGGYKALDNTALEAEMESIIGQRLPPNTRGRATSILVRKARANESWKDTDSFNARFQDAVETMNMHGAQSNLRRQQLVESCLTVIRLAQDFATLASQYGKTIISEHALPDSKRTIKPRKDLGGVLGGEKFVVQGILFKFATDEKNMFKSLHDPLEAANKIAGLELKGLKCYFSTRTPNLSFPLMALIDYKGYRLVAMSVLPIDKTTLKYGSADAGRTILLEDPDLNTLMRDASLQLNLKPHMVGPKGREVELVSAADLEGHVGYDGRFYMLDFSRTMPPVHTGLKDRPDHLYQQFRPEFVRSHTCPLSPDACSMFGRHNGALHDSEIVEATHYLKQTHIPDVARKVVAEAEDARDILSFSVSEALHRRGVNMRYLGLVHHELLRYKTESRLVDLSLIEMCARVLKNKLRGQMRKVLKALKDPSEAPFNDLVMEEFNAIFGQNVHTHALWNDYVPKMLVENFSASRADLPEDLDSFMRTLTFGSTAGKWVLMMRVNSMTGIEVEPAVMEQFQREPKMFDRAEVLDYLDVMGLRERVKHLNIINHAKGEFYYLKGLMRHNHSSSIEYFEKAEQCLEDALHSSPTDPQLLSTMGNILFEHAKKLAMVNPQDPQVMPHLQRCKQYFLSAIRYDSNNFLIFRDYAIFLEHLEDLDGAEEYYLRSLTLNPNQMEGLRRYGAFLRTFRGDREAAAPFFDRYKVICEQFADGLSDKSGPQGQAAATGGSKSPFFAAGASVSPPASPRPASPRPAPPRLVPCTPSRQKSAFSASAPSGQTILAAARGTQQDQDLPRFSVHRKPARPLKAEQLAAASSLEEEKKKKLSLSSDGGE